MWVFYLISLPLTTGMVLFTLRYFAGPDVPRYVLFTVGYTWFCSLSIIILVPADIWATMSSNQENGAISFFWSWSYWSTFLLTWAVVPLIQGFEDAGDFTVSERLKTSVHVNLIFYLIVGSIGLFGLILLILTHNKWKGSLLGFAMACSNTFGLVTGAFLLGFGLSEIPKSIWRNADWTIRQKVLTHKIAQMAVKLDDAHQELSNAIVFREDPSFKPQGGRLGENDMDYDTDEKSMATLRRHLRGAREEYYRYKSEYMTYVLEALELEDTIKNYERRNSTGWEYNSSIRPARTGKLGSLCDTLEFLWKCILRKQVEKGLAVILGIMSVAILLAEATLLPSIDLSLFSILIKSVGTQEVLVQVFAFVPLMYMCICTYYSLFKIGMLMFYSLTPRQTSSVNLLMICSMVARYAPPVSYNFLNLIRLGKNKTTIFEQERNGAEMKPTSNLITDEINGRLSKTSKEDTSRSREAITKKYAVVREQGRPASKLKSEEKNAASADSLSDEGNTNSSNSSGGSSSGLTSTWQSMKTGFQSFKVNIGAKKFLPLRQIQENTGSSHSSSESLDDIFQKLKRPTLNQSIYNDND